MVNISNFAHFLKKFPLNGFCRHGPWWIFFMGLFAELGKLNQLLGKKYEKYEETCLFMHVPGSPKFLKNIHPRFYRKGTFIPKRVFMGVCLT